MAVTSGPAPFVGREEELAALRAALDGLRAGSGFAARVRAPGGLGKTRLVTEALGETDDLPTWRGVASQLESGAPNALISATLRLGPDSRTWDAQRFADVVERTAMEQPCLVVVDDLQWADEASLLALDKVAHLTRSTSVGLVTLARPDPVPPGLLRLERSLEQAANLIRIEVESLREDELLHLAQEVLGTEVPDRVAGLLRATGGNALFATELLWGAGRPGVQDGDVEPNLRASITRHLAALDARDLELLRWAATLGTNFDVRQLAVVCDRDLQDVLDALRAATTIGILHVERSSGRFGHDFIRDALYEDEAEPLRAARHRDVVLRLDDAGLGVEAWGVHIERADLTGVDGAVRLLREAAGTRLPIPDARRGDLLLRAAGRWVGEPPLDLLLEALERLPPTHPRRGEVLDRLLAAADHLRPDERTRLLLGVAHTHAEAAATFERLDQLGLDDFGAALVEVERVDGVLTRAESASSAGGWARRGAELARLAEEAGHLLWAIQANVYAAVTAPTGSTDVVRDGVERALALAQRDPSPDARIRLAGWLVQQGPYLGVASDLIPPLDEAIDLARTVDSDTLAPLEATALTIDLRDGRWDDLPTRLDAFLEAHGDLRPLLGTGSWLANLACWVLVELGDLDGAERFDRLAADVPARPGTEQERAAYHRAQAANLAAARGDRERAAELLREAVEVGPLAPAHALQGVMLGDSDLAQRILDDGRSLVGERPVELEAHWLAFTEAVVAGDRERAEACSDRIRRRPAFRWDSFHFDEVLGRLHAEDGDTTAAVTAYELALADFEERDATLAAARVRKSLRDLGVRRPGTHAKRTADHGWEAITDAEWRTLDLVEQDLLYREIAERLFLSRRTVETHVARASRKLQVNNRRALTAMLRDAEGAAHLAAFREG